MRLIDADDFYKRYCEMYEDGVDEGEIDRIAYMISTEPTAYNVEKVVEQLEERSKRGMKCDECINRTRVDDCTDICDRGAFAKAIEVVRNGGVE